MSVTQNRNSYTLRGHPLDSLEEPISQSNNLTGYREEKPYKLRLYEYQYNDWLYTSKPITSFRPQSRNNHINTQLDHHLSMLTLLGKNPIHEKSIISESPNTELSCSSPTYSEHLPHLNWHNLEDRRKYPLLGMMFKLGCGKSGSY